MLSEFVQEYFLNPIQFPDKYAPYNTVNTIVFAALALLAAYLIYKILGRLKVKIDSAFFFSIIPFIFFGSIVRVLSDAHVLPRGIWFITPGVYVLTFALVFGAIMLSLALKNFFGRNFNKTVFFIGLIFAVFVFIPLAPLLHDLILASEILFLALVPVALIVLVKKFGAVERTAIFSQCFDGAASFVGVQSGGYVGQHVLENAFMGFHPIVFYLIKAVFAIFFVWVVGRELGKEEQLKNYLLLLVTIFGLAPGARDFLRIVAGV
jgi:uncharacterized membrane protein